MGIKESFQKLVGQLPDDEEAKEEPQNAPPDGYEWALIKRETGGQEEQKQESKQEGTLQSASEGGKAEGKEEPMTAPMTPQIIVRSSTAPPGERMQPFNPERLTMEQLRTALKTEGTRETLFNAISGHMTSGGEVN